MTPDPVVPQLFVGVDTAAATFTAPWSRTDAPVSTPRPYHQTPHGFAALQAPLAATGVLPAATLVVIGATRSPWIALAVALHPAGFRVSVIRAHHCAVPKPMPPMPRICATSPGCCVPPSGFHPLPCIP